MAFMTTESETTVFVRARFWQLHQAGGLGWHPAKKTSSKLLIANEKCLTSELLDTYLGPFLHLFLSFVRLG